MDLAFVVSGTASKEIALCARVGSNGGEVPKIEWFGRLHVVMPVKRCLVAGSFQRFRVDERSGDSSERSQFF